MRLAVIALVVVAPIVSLAQPQDRRARSHFEAGSSYYDQGRYEEALREFEEAYRLAPDAQKPVMLFNMGQAQERLGRLGDAIDTFRRYLEIATDADDRGVVQERVQNLEARLQATAIVLNVSVAGARVLVDGQERGQSPLARPLLVTPGAHDIRIEKEGFQPFTLRVSVPAGEQVETDASLVALPPPPPPAPEPPPRAPEPPPPEPAPAPPSPRGRTYTWVAAAVAGGAAIAGGVLGFMALGKSDKANEAAEEGIDHVAYDDASSSARTLAVFADISLGLAVVAAGAAVVLYLVEGSSGSGESEARASPVPIVLDGGAGLGLAGAF
ncbi:MAG: tetratricopeptide repeat protein [Deltaproteobacteria bacterium]|nr:tetratricopeptide repeat protein [Deltaproteobacteria bacterium]